MSAQEEKRKSDLQRYIVFRVKAIEFLDLSGLHSGLRDKHIGPWPPFRPPQFTADSVRTVCLSWLALFVDKNGMNVIKLWAEVFPQHTKRIEDAWALMAPAWPVFQDFRNRAGFHADKPMRYFAARTRVHTEHASVDRALKEFEKLFHFFLKAEAKELPELEAALDDLLDELEMKHGRPYQREQFKAYMMIPDTRPTSVKH